MKQKEGKRKEAGKQLAEILTGGREDQLGNSTKAFRSFIFVCISLPSIHMY